MTPEELEQRAYAFALRILRFCPTLPHTCEGQEIRSQLLRAGMGTVGNYISARRARSMREFVAHLGKVTDEAAEAKLWLRLTVDGQVCTSDEAHSLRAEATELEKIFSASYRTSRENLRKVAARNRTRKAPISPNQITKSPNHQITKS